jgi:hypothetical protein
MPLDLGYGDGQQPRPTPHCGGAATRPVRSTPSHVPTEAPPGAPPSVRRTSRPITSAVEKMRMGLSATAAFATNHDCVASVVAACIACSPSAPRDRIFGEGQGPVPDADVPLAPVLVGDAARVGSLRSLLTRRSCHPGRLFACRLKARLRRFLRARPQYAVERPGDRAS